MRHEVDGTPNQARVFADGLCTVTVERETTASTGQIYEQQRGGVTAILDTINCLCCKHRYKTETCHKGSGVAQVRSKVVATAQDCAVDQLVAGHWKNSGVMQRFNSELLLG